MKIGLACFFLSKVFVRPYNHQEYKYSLLLAAFPSFLFISFPRFTSFYTCFALAFVARILTSLARVAYLEAGRFSLSRAFSFTSTVHLLYCCCLLNENVLTSGELKFCHLCHCEPFMFFSFHLTVSNIAFLISLAVKNLF